MNSVYSDTRFLNFIYLLTLVFLVESCEMDSSVSSGDTGTAGSTARFTVLNDYLYTVDLNNLHTFYISAENEIEYKENVNVGFGIETIFPYNNRLFLGAQNGLYIYDLANPAAPQQLSFTTHFVSRDPVVVEGNRAYVTLNSWDSELQIFDISDLSNPERLTTYDLESPGGLAIKDSVLFVCDRGIKIFNVKNDAIKWLHSYDIPNARDLIITNNLLIVTSGSGLKQYLINPDYSLEFQSELLISDYYF